MTHTTNPALLLAGTPGVCRFCDCTDDAPCYDATRDRACAWIPGSNNTACDALPCEAAWAALLAGAAKRPQVIP